MFHLCWLAVSRVVTGCSNHDRGRKKHFLTTVLHQMTVSEQYFHQTFALQVGQIHSVSMHKRMNGGVTHPLLSMGKKCEHDKLPRINYTDVSNMSFHEYSSCNTQLGSDCNQMLENITVKRSIWQNKENAVVVNNNLCSDGWPQASCCWLGHKDKAPLSFS